MQENARAVQSCASNRTYQLVKPIWATRVNWTMRNSWSIKDQTIHTLVDICSWPVKLFSNDIHWFHLSNLVIASRVWIDTWLRWLDTVCMVNNKIKSLLRQKALHSPWPSVLWCLFLLHFLPRKKASLFEQRAQSGQCLVEWRGNLCIHPSIRPFVNPLLYASQPVMESC